MKTRELLKLDDKTMADAIQSMKVKECEKHAINYSRMLGVSHDRAIMAAVHAAFISDQDEHVSMRVHKAVSKMAKEESDCEEAEAMILSALYLMLVYKKTNGFQLMDTLSSVLKENF
jgi:alpha-D-ribose 1-methylphosphonate 5-triphosphate synthase subunit PhnG